MIDGIHHVQITAPPGFEDAMRAFYTGVLGLPEVQKPAILQPRGGLWFSCGELEVHVGVDADPENHTSRRHVGLLVSSLANVRESLARGGIDVEEDRAPLEHVVRFYCRDPAGNRVEFVQKRG